MPQLSRGEVLDRIACGESLRGVNLVRADLAAMELARADLAEANLRMADLSRANLREARLTGCFLSGAVLNQAVLVGASLVEASMIGAMLKGASLSRADLSGADLTGATLQEADLEGAYLVGTYLNETDLSGARLPGAYMRMAQMSGSTMTEAMLEGADLSYTDLSGVRLDGANLTAANLTGANLSGGSLAGCNLRDADLTGADLQGCNLTGAKLRGIKFSGVKLADAWAEWVDLGAGDREPSRGSLEEVFVGMIGKPIAQLLVEGRVGDDVLAVIVAHLCQFQVTHPSNCDVSLRGIQQGTGSSAVYLEADHELSLAAYLAEFADICGKGSLELFEKLASAVAASGEQPPPKAAAAAPASLFGLAAQASMTQADPAGHPLGQAVPCVEALQHTPFWTSDKAFVILTGSRQIWLEATSNQSLTLRPPHGAVVGVDLIRGHFVCEELRRNREAVNSQ